MSTKETQENHTEDTKELYETVARRISEVRREAGLSHHALAAKLDVPVCYTEILENGILVSTDGKNFFRWEECPFEKEELLKISGQLSNGIGSDSGIRSIDPETVFFCPVTMNSTAALDEIHDIAKCRDITSCLTRQAVGRFSVKYRLFYRQLCLKSGKKNAEMMRYRILSALAKYKAQA